MRLMQRAHKWSGLIAVLMVATSLAWLPVRSAAADPPRRFQGVIMDRQGSTLVINEHPLQLTRDTRVMLGDKTPASDALLVPSSWVAVIVDPPSADGQRINTIYLLPGRLNQAELFALFSGGPK